MSDYEASMTCESSPN